MTINAMIPEASVISNTQQELSHQPLRQCVQIALQRYFLQLEGQNPTELHDMVIAEVEPPLLTAVLELTRGNQSKAAKILGISRGTLRKKLKIYQLD